jgi:hypothetical protein
LPWQTARRSRKSTPHARGLPGEPGRGGEDWDLMRHRAADSSPLPDGPRRAQICEAAVVLRGST